MIYDGVNHLGKIILILSARKCTVALVGGGTYPTPEEISFAHNGVLLLNELLEFNRSVLEVMRPPHIMEAIGSRNLDRSNYFNLWHLFQKMKFGSATSNFH